MIGILSVLHAAMLQILEINNIEKTHYLIR